MKIDTQSLQKCGIPDYMHSWIIRFYENGVPPGEFLTAVIDNDLRAACASADDTNRHLLFNYMMWFHNHAPAGTWGYQRATDTYIKRFHEGAEER